jgi:hypothetical protein
LRFGAKLDLPSLIHEEMDLQHESFEVIKTSPGRRYKEDLTTEHTIRKTTITETKVNYNITDNSLSQISNPFGRAVDTSFQGSKLNLDQNKQEPKVKRVEKEPYSNEERGIDSESFFR